MEAVGYPVNRHTSNTQSPRASAILHISRLTRPCRNILDFLSSRPMHAISFFFIHSSGVIHPDSHPMEAVNSLLVAGHKVDAQCVR